MANKPKTKKIAHRGKIYICSVRNGKVTVRLQRTACGQNVIAGTFNMVNGNWENESNKAHLPKYVKSEIEKSFLGTTI